MAETRIIVRVEYDQYKAMTHQKCGGAGYNLATFNSIKSAIICKQQHSKEWPGHRFILIRVK